MRSDGEIIDVKPGEQPPADALEIPPEDLERLRLLGKKARIAWYRKQLRAIAAVRLDETPDDRRQERNRRKAERRRRA